MKHLVKLRRRRLKTRKSRRVQIHFVLGMERHLRWATRLSQLKVSWCHFSKMVKERQSNFTDLVVVNHLFFHLTLPPPMYWCNHLGGGEAEACRNIDGLSYGHPAYMLLFLMLLVIHVEMYNNGIQIFHLRGENKYNC